MIDLIPVKCLINGQLYEGEVSPDISLLQFLRRDVGLTGTKNGCSAGHCGACTIVLDGKAVRSCLIKMGSKRIAGARIETVEGLSIGSSLHLLQSAFIEEGAIQCGFCTPGMLMSASALLLKNPSPTIDQIKQHLTKTNNICRCTGYIPIVRAIRKAAVEIGKGSRYKETATVLHEERADEPILRREAAKRVTGTTKFSDDMTMDNMLYGAILWSEYPHAEILGIDITAAESLIGVERIITANDIPGENQVGLMIKDQPGIASGKVRHIGEAVAAVFAESEESAKRALQKIKVSYRELEGVFSIEEASAENAPEIHQNGNLFYKARIDRGDPESILGRCAFVVEGTFTTPAIEHGYMEPESGWGIPNEDGGITVKIGSQSVFDDQEILANLLNMQKEKIRIVQLPMGGGFGAKQDLLIHQFLALGAKLTGRPVKITLSRKESLCSHVKRHPGVMRYTIGADSDGNLSAVKACIDVDTGAYASHGMSVLDMMVHFACGGYFVPNIQVRGRAWYTNNIPNGAMRGFGANQVTFAIESLIDELARRLNMDPFEIRKLNGLEEGKVTATDHVLEPGMTSFKTTLSKAQEEYEKLHLTETAIGKRIGVGVASSFRSFGYGLSAPESAGADAELCDSGEIILRVSQHELGQGAQSALVKLAAGELGILPERIKIQQPDTFETPPTGANSGSRQTYLTGNALLSACRRLKEDSADLKTPVRVKATYSPMETLPLDPGGTSRLGRSDFRSRRSYYGYASTTQVAVVEVDTETGEVEVVKIIAAVDLGKAINKKAVVGQIEGGVVMGLGYALSEKFVLENGRTKTDTLLKCGLPKAGQAPEIISILVEEPHPYGPWGAKGFAEIPGLATTPAITNAVYDAIGVRIYDLPAKNELILERMKGGERRNNTNELCEQPNVAERVPQTFQSETKNYS